MIDNHKKKVTPLRTALDDLASAQKNEEMIKEKDQKNFWDYNKFSSSIEIDSDSTTNTDYFRLKQRTGNFDVDIIQTPKISKLKPGQKKKVLRMVTLPN